jgi:hypothetical protein
MIFPLEWRRKAVSFWVRRSHRPAHPSVPSTEASPGTWSAAKRGHSFDGAILLSPTGRERLRRCSITRLRHLSSHRREKDGTHSPRERVPIGRECNAAHRVISVRVPASEFATASIASTDHHALRYVASNSQPSGAHARQPIGLLIFSNRCMRNAPRSPQPIALRRNSLAHTVKDLQPLAPGKISDPPSL